VHCGSHDRGGQRRRRKARCKQGRKT
jgi:hypothetical protein